MADTWPPTDPLSNTSLDADADPVTGAGGGREQINLAVQRLNALLLAGDSGATLFSSDNPQTSFPVVGSTNGDILQVTSNGGSPVSSGKQFQTTIPATGATDATVPTSKAVKTYVDTEISSIGAYQVGGRVSNTGVVTNLPGGNIGTIDLSGNVYTVNLVIPFATTDYVISLTAEENTTINGEANAMVTGRFTNKFEFSVYRSGSTTTTHDSVHVMAWGVQ